MRTAGVRKITTGFVIQTYEEDENGKCTGKCISQEFIAGDDVVWEKDMKNGTVLAMRPPDEPEHDYQPFEMIQPPDSAQSIVDMKKGFDSPQG